MARRGCSGSPSSIRCSTRRAGSPGGRSTAEGDYLFLGLDEGAPLFAPLVRTEALGQRAWSVFRLLAMMSPKDAAIWGAARSLNEWHNRHGFCGICGERDRTLPRRLGPQLPALRRRAFPARRSGRDHARRA